ncbi:glycosyltransferase family 2 protein [Alloscardovia sp. HMSC034E08]|uniref:glycosyltransferase family 2 protein n=1 Tax=Alloscardovia sp. HMSC034E08 TaxID=1739413 RepID=UPI0008C9825D|nr:glycosyltransferase family 2 protein [Alloscardovia sp. HMSC034E08]OFQ99509.1 glycosyl hydrolase [Alloscardovia sp. HMSC034E08]
MAKRSLTILIPCYNEEESTGPLFSRLASLVEDNKEKIDYQLLFVDDGSSDNTRVLIKDFACTHDYAKYIFLSRNFGKEKAMFAGIQHVTTDALVIIDADLQDPPELIPQMVELWKQGYDDVYAKRRSRSGETWLKKFTSRTYYNLLQKLTDVPIQKDTGDFRLLDRKCIEALQRLDESERNSKALFSWIGFKKIEFLYDRDERVAGKTKWNYGKLFGLALDGITTYTIAPLRVATFFGGFVSIVSVFYAIYIFVHTLITGIDVPGYASTLFTILFLGGIQLLSLGIIGEYLGRIFLQTKGRPNYFVQEDNLGSEFHEDDSM